MYIITPPRGEGRVIAFHFSHSGYVHHGRARRGLARGQPHGEGSHRGLRRGAIINLNGAENQVEGSVMDGFGTVWLLEMTYDEGKAVQSNFHDFPLLRINAAPVRVATHFIQSINPSTALGEPSYPVVPPAVCNAIFAATGKRIRT